MLQIYNPLTLFKLRYKSASGRTDKVSESQAKYELDHFLEKKHPAVKRLLITEQHAPGQEFLLVNPEMAEQMNKAGLKPPQALPQMDADTIINSDFAKSYRSAREITVRHKNGHIINNADIQKNINPFLNAIKHPKNQKHVESKKKLNEEKGKKIDAQNKKAQSNNVVNDDGWSSVSESDEELMFPMEL